MRTGALEHEGHGIGAVIGLDGDDVIVAGALEHLGHVGEVDAHGDVAVAAVVLEALGSEEEGNQGNVAGVHRRAVEVGVVHQILDRLHHLLQQAPLHQP